MQKIILWVVGILIIAGGWYLYSSNGVSREAPANVEDVADASAGGEVTSSPQPVPDASGADVEEMIVANVPAEVITFTDAGFVPSSVTIKKGQTVRWVNNSSSKVWPASAVHPSHSVYPQKSASDCLGSSFDACKGLAQGESWDFKFDYVGEWKFHNHLDASQRGSVTVTE